MLKKKKYVVFRVENRKFALHLSNVDRVVRIVEVTPLSKAPKFILGTINFKGEFLPVINLRILFDLIGKEISLSDQLIIATISSKKVALWVDFVSGIIERDDNEIIKTDKILLNSEYVEGSIKFNDEIVIIHDLETFFEQNEKAIERAKIKKKVTSKT